MKLLLDQNPSYKLIQQLAPYYPDSAQLRLLGMETFDDRDIWQYAKENGFIIATQDADFELLSQLHGFPPKVIWLRCGNTSTANILRLLVENHDVLLAFATDDTLACIELH
jgi:predicted nuclease of predicted toxin-antitoxin system